MKIQFPFKRRKLPRSLFNPFRAASASSSTSNSCTSSSSPWSGDLRAHKQLPGAPEICIEQSTYVNDKLANIIPPAQIRELEEAFRVFDRNGDGKISVSELGCVLKMLGDDPTEQELRLMVEEADKDGDGYIDLDEFISLNSSGLDETANGDELKHAFRIFDADNNGFISAEELYRVFRSLGERCTLEDCHQMIKGVDEDGDGFVNFTEFRKMMTATM
eukprot:c25913_g1_i1 orf=583-1236(-)